MECSSDYVNSFLKYVDSFLANIRPDDPLPVRAPCYKVTETEIDGQIIDIVYHYLNHRECPAYLRSLVGHRVWTVIRNPEANGQDDEERHYDAVDHGNHTYEPMKLIQDVTSRANAVIRELQKTLSPSVVESLPRYLPVSQYAIKNTRRKMENRHVILQDLNTLYNLDVRIFGPSHAYYAVFDGHAGPDAAVYSAALLHQYLIQNPFYETDPVKALKHAFYITDTNFAKKSEKERLKGGATAVVALVREKRLVVAWLGDSLALLVRKRTPVQIVQPHKPESNSERKRIEDVGGCVVNIQGTWRVLGQLAVSRAIGDVKYKPYLTSECDIKSLEICGDEDFLILACDGLWDCLSPETTVDIVYSYLLNNDGDTDGVGRCLVEAARSSGSDDNITAIVVFLRPVSVLMEEERTRIEQGQVPEMESFVMTQNPSLPPSINAIFTPPDHIASTPSPQLATKDANGHPSPKDPSKLPSNLECTAPPLLPDDDSDEGVGAEITGEKEFDYPEEVDSKVSAEDVNLVLAEFDSVTDVGLETGEVEAEVEDEDDDDDLWSYYKTEPQQETKNEDLIGSGASEVIVDTRPVNSDMDKPSPLSRDDSPTFIKEASPSGSPQTPGSPRTVEGFVTSVELNAPGESYNTNLAINQSTEYLGGGPIEQNSGPFSVYVSSSPEPASIEPQPPLENLQPSPSAPSPALVEEEPHDNPTEESEGSPAVEVVHAQSTVEVVDHTYSPVEVVDHTYSPVEVVDHTQSPVEVVDHTQSPVEFVDHTQSPVEFVDHTQSPVEVVDHTQSPVEVVDHTQSPVEVVDHTQSPVEVVDHTQLTVEVVDHIQSTVEVADHAQLTIEVVDDMVKVTKEGLFDNQMPDIMTQSITGDLPTEPYTLTQESVLISPVMEDVKSTQEIIDAVQNVCQTSTSQLVEVSTTESEFVCQQLSEVSDVKESVSEVILSNDAHELIIPDVTQQLLNDFDGTSHAALEQVEEKFNQDIKRDLDPPLDQMIASFHEDRTQHPDLIQASELSPELSSSPLQEERLSPAAETPTVDLLGIQEVHGVTNRLSQLELTEQVTKDETPPVPSPRTPLATSPVVPKIEPKTPVSASRSAPPKPSPRSVGSKPLTSKLSSAPSPTSTGPSAGAKSTPKRPSSLSAANPLRKPEAAKTTATTKTRPSTTTSTRVAAASASPASAPAKTRVPPAKAAGPPKPRVPASSAPRTNPGVAKSRPSASPQAPHSNTTTRRSIQSTKQSTGATSTRSTLTTTSKTTQNGVATSTGRGVTKTTTTTTSKKPLTTKTTTTTTTRLSSGQASRKPMSPSTTTAKTTSTSTSSSTLRTKGVSSTAPPATKDTKNSTNRMISTTAKTTTTRSSQPLSKTTTAASTKSRFPLKTTKTSVGTKNEKVSTAKGAPKIKLHDPVIPNGENKIVEEETTVEVKEKIIEETMVMETHETAVENVTLKQNQLLVNGDHS